MLNELLHLSDAQSLVLYAILGVLLLFFIRTNVRRRETATSATRPRLVEPYSIAYLRGGYQEAIQVATFSLIDRGLLSVQGRKLHTTAERVSRHERRHPAETALLEKFRVPAKASAIFRDPGLRRVCQQQCADPLRSQGLIATDDVYAARRPLFRLGLLLLLGLAGVEFANALYAYALDKIGFLIALTGLFCAYLVYTYGRRRTPLGDHALADLRTSLAALKSRGRLIEPGAANEDATLLAAAFGLTALSGRRFPYLRKIFPQDTSLYSSGASDGG